MGGVVLVLSSPQPPYVVKAVATKSGAGERAVLGDMIVYCTCCDCYSACCVIVMVVSVVSVVTVVMVVTVLCWL